MVESPSHALFQAIYATPSTPHIVQYKHNNAKNGETWKLLAGSTGMPGSYREVNKVQIQII
jgi:hypothetical protein